MSLINIAKDAKKPLFINAAHVTALQVQILPKEGQIMIFSLQGLAMHLRESDGNVDIAEVVRKLVDAGAELELLSHSEENGVQQFVAPWAVSFMTVSQQDAATGVQGVIVGVGGAGQVTSNNVQPEKLVGLLQAVKKSGRTLLEFDPDDVYSRWYHPEKLYIDPMSVTRMREDGGAQIHVSFDTGGYLDVQDGTKRRIKKEHPKWGFSRSFSEAEKRREASGGNILLRDFVQKIMQLNTSFVSVKGAKTICFKPEDISSISFEDRKGPPNCYEMYIEFIKTAADPYSSPARASFNTAEDRLQAFTDLQEQVAKKSAEVLLKRDTHMPKKLPRHPTPK